jgi:hypothetical protein
MLVTSSLRSVYYLTRLIALAISETFRKESRVFPLTVAGTPFAGIPSPELDHAWHELLEGQNTTLITCAFLSLADISIGTVIRVTREDLNYYNVTSLPLADGSGFASEIFMTHELHCLVGLYSWMMESEHTKTMRRRR